MTPAFGGQYSIQLSYGRNIVLTTTHPSLVAGSCPAFPGQAFDSREAMLREIHSAHPAELRAHGIT